MADSFYDPGPQRANKVRALFARVARRYDLINDLQSFGLHRRWKRVVIETAHGRAGELALDVCCGTGDLAVGLAQRGLRVVGLDFSEPMLGVARRKTRRLLGGRGRASSSETAKTRHAEEEESGSGSQGGEEEPIKFIQGDAQQLPFADGSFDIVTVGYGLRNLVDWGQGLSEMQRVARRGGRVLVLDFGNPENRLWRGIYYGYLRLFVPLLGLCFCGNAGAYRYILESLRHYPAQQGVAARMRELGLARVQVINFLGGIMSINYGEKL